MENIKDFILDFKQLSNGGFRAVKHIKTSYGILIATIFKGASYTDNGDGFFVEIGSGKKNRFYLSEVSETELKYLFQLLRKL